MSDKKEPRTTHCPLCDEQVEYDTNATAHVDDRHAAAGEFVVIWWGCVTCLNCGNNIYEGSDYPLEKVERDDEPHDDYDPREEALTLAQRNAGWSGRGW